DLVLELRGHLAEAALVGRKPGRELRHGLGEPISEGSVLRSLRRGVTHARDQAAEPAGLLQPPLGPRPCDHKLADAGHEGVEALGGEADGALDGLAVTLAPRPAWGPRL